MKTLSVTLALGLAVLSTGCSVLFMEKPPTGDGPVARGNCTRSLVAPVIDGLVGLAYLGQAASSDLQIWESSGLSADEDINAYRLTSLVLAAGMSYSAIKGFGYSSSCKRRNALSEQAVLDHLRNLAVRN